VALEVAGVLEADLDLIVCRKIPVPLNPEAGFGAIAETHALPDADAGQGQGVSGKWSGTAVNDDGDKAETFLIIKEHPDGNHPPTNCIGCPSQALLPFNKPIDDMH